MSSALPSPLSVAFDAGPLHGPRTGVGYAVDALRRALADRVDVAVHDYVLSFRAELADGTRRLPLPAALAQRVWGRLDRPSADRWLRDAHGDPVQLVHGTNYVVPPTRLPAVVSVYDCWFLEHPELAGAHVRRAGEVLRKAVERGAVVHTSSHATEAKVRRLFPTAAVCTVHLGPLDAPAVAPATPVPELTDRPFVLAIGTLERRKNLPALVRAFGALAGGDTEVRLVLAGGPGDDADAVADAIDALPNGVADRVILTGRIDEPIRGWMLRHASVLAYPSLDEGFGFPLLDAMRAGTPVVASTAGSIPEVAGDAAVLVDAADEDGLAAALGEVLRNTDRRTALVTAGDAQWRTFSWQRCADEMVHLYRRVVEGDVEGMR
ncbi:MAG: glycosyltransferase family 4 protein [Ilumatobacteraceae bacterium]